VANFSYLASISASLGSATAPYGGTPGTTTGTNGQPVTTYTYNFNDTTQDANGQYRRFVQVVLTTGSGGAITSATCSARCPVQTYFIGYATYAINGRQNVKIGGYSGPSGLVDLKVSSQAVATRNPRLIMIVIDRSASMLLPDGGASGLPPAIVQFLDFFDTSSDNIGIVSFGSSARLEMPLTTNFLIAGTNNLTDAYETNAQGGAEPGVDPEDTNDAQFSTNGLRRLKFGGQTAADDGIRLAMEQLMANSGFNDPDVVKYMVIFTDGKWNACRTLLAAPGYTNEITVPAAASTTVVFSNNAAATAGGNMTNGHDPGPWSTNLVADTNLVPVPSLGLIAAHSSLPFITNAIAYTCPSQSANFANLISNHTNDTWQSADTTANEPFNNPGSTIIGAPMAVTNTTWLGTNSVTVGSQTPGTINYYTHSVDVWLTPGSVAYYYTNTVAATLGTPTSTYVSDYTNPDKHINLYIGFGGKVDLVVPGYVVDGLAYDGIDLPYSDPETSGYPRFRANNYQEAFMWDDETAPITASEPSSGYISNSLHRQLMFRNYPNLLTGFYVFRPDEPLQTYNASGPTGLQGIEPLDDTTPATQRPLYGLGPYYPSAGFYWPFDLVGVDYDPTYALIDPNSDPDPNFSQGLFGGSRHIAYSINMLSTNAAPEWAGELFYKSTSGAGTNTISGTGSTAASQIMASSDWQAGAPPFVTAMGGITGLMTNEAAHDTNIKPNPSVWRPVTFNGSSFSLPFSSIVPSTTTGSHTGGYVTDGNGNYYENTMAWSGRPTHYYDFSKSSWEPIADNHDTNVQFLQLGYWKASEYGWHARALGVTIYTVGYGVYVSQDQQVFLAQLANATNTTAGSGSNIAFNPGQPIGQQFYATNAAQISNDFYSVGQAINAALTQ
jgi:hypothetical protein